MSSEEHNEEFRILLVDDEPGVIDALKAYMEENMVCEVYAARNGTDAVELLQTAPFDLIVTDVNHPGINGLDLTRYVKEHFDTNIIILTGYRDTKPEDAEAAGADVLFYKPVLLKTFLQAVEKIFKVVDSAQDEESWNSEGSVLVVDEVVLIL